MMASKFGFKSAKCNYDWHQSSSLITGWICWTLYDIGGPADLSEGVCNHKAWSKKIYTEVVCFPTDILSLLNNLWNISNHNFFSEILLKTY